jgi:hypothetical protein
LQGAETKQHEVDREAAFGPGPSDVLKSTNDLHFVNIASATRRALEESSNFEGPVRRQARDAKYIDVYAVKNKGKQGLVVLSDQDGEGQKDKPLDNFEQRLSGHLRNSGASQGDTERIRIYVSGRSVEDLANSNGKFSFSSVNSGDEIILTYLEGEDLLPEIVEAPKDMVSVPLNSFEADKPVDFEVYLYLKQNQKFYKYLRPGRSLSGKQINKLISSNMVQLFVHKGDASLFKGHHLKNKIEGTRNSKMKKKAG